MCSNDFERAIGYNAYTCTFDGVPNEASTFSTDYRVYVNFEDGNCVSTSEDGIIDEAPDGDDCLVFLRSYSHYENLQEGNWRVLAPNEQFNDEIEGPGITFVLPNNENGDAYLQATFLCPTGMRYIFF